MGDVADILGLGDGSLGKAAALGSSSSSNNKKLKKPEGMSREVFALLGADSVPSLMPSSGTVGEMKLRKHIPAQKWVWSKYSNSARADGVEFEHWQREANVNIDYAFARFNKKTAVVEYADEEYEVLADDSHGWTKQETDTLFKLCDEFDLRWYVIEDRWPHQPQRSVTDLKARYYGVAKTILLARRNKKVVKSIQRQTGTSEPSATTKVIPNTAKVTAKATALVENAIIDYTFDKEVEEKRVSQLELLFSRSPAEEKEETNLVNEIRRIDMQLRRMQKDAPKTSKGAKSSKAKVSAPALQHFPPTLMESILNDELPGVKIEVPKGPGVSLRSERLRIMPSHVGIGSRIHQKMDTLLTELGVPLRPVPTVRVCNAFDKLRQDTVKLLALQAKLFDAKAEICTLQGLPAPVRPGQTKPRTKKKTQTTTSGHAVVHDLSNPAIDLSGSTSTIPAVVSTNSSSGSAGGDVNKKKKNASTKIKTESAVDGSTSSSQQTKRKSVAGSGGARKKAKNTA